MALNAKKDKKKAYRVLSALLGLIIVSTVIFFILEKTHMIDFIKAGQPVIDSQPTVEELKKQEIANLNEKQQYLEGHDTANNQSSTTGKLEISAVRGRNNTVTIYSKIYESSATKCLLEISNDSKIYSKEAAVIYQADYSICAGYSVTIDELGIGIWNIKLTTTSSSGNLTATTQLVVD